MFRKNVQYQNVVEYVDQFISLHHNKKENAAFWRENSSWMQSSPLQLATPLQISTLLLPEFLLYHVCGSVGPLSEDKGDAENLALFSVNPYSNLLE